MNDEQFRENLNLLYDVTLGTPEKDIQKIIERDLSQCGLMFRVFSRIKDKASVLRKIDLKREKYLKENRKMQDIIGIRIVLYFKDDIDICINILKKKFEMDSCEHDRPDLATFKPQRINYVFSIPESILQIPGGIREACLIDNTFEVQIRTIFSEGWHEVEHDIRYKYFDEWKSLNSLYRELNGISAVLEICDNNILSICDSVAYQKYKNKEWDSMIRNRFRLRFVNQKINEKLTEVLDCNPDIGKEIFRFDRERLVCWLADCHFPKTCDNIIYLINELEIHNEKIHILTPEVLVEKCSALSAI